MSVQLKGNNYYAAISYKKDGRYCVDWIALNVDGIEEAKVKHDLIVKQRYNGKGKIYNLEKIKVSDVLPELTNQYNERVENGIISQQTLDLYMYYITKYIEPFFGDIRCVEIKRKTLKNFQSELLHGSHRYSWRPVSAKTVKKIFVPLREALEIMVADELINVNVSVGIRFEKVKYEKYVPTFIDGANYLKLCDWIKENDPEFYLPMMLAGSLGLRRSEVAGLRFCDIDIENRLLICEQGRCSGYISKLKNSASRAPLKLNDFFVDYLSEYFESHEHNPRDFIFTNPKTNKPYSVDWFSRRIAEDSQKCLGMKVTFHGLRHSMASNLVNSGAPMTLVQRQLRHADLNSTMIYSHPDTDASERAGRIFDESIRKLKKD